ncbi:MAG: DUF72 domain-containing protein [Planctomycetota bacterium]
MPATQLSLFDGPGDEAEAGSRRSRGGEPVAAAAVDAATRATAAALSSRIRLGTSSWSFPGWTGLVYAARSGRPESEQRLAREGLAAYASHPLFRTVSLDRTFYAPLPAAEFARYAAQVPDGFRFVVKAPQAFTDPAVRKPASGVAARDNPSFLDAAAAAATFVTPAMLGLGEKAGALVFQFPPLGRRLVANLRQTAGRIAAFLSTLPEEVAGRRPLYAVEVRDPELACDDFAAAIGDAGGVPCLAIHARMQPVAEQARAFGLDAAGCGLPLVARWNLHAGRRYEEAKVDYAPFDRLVEEDLPTRTALANLARAAAQSSRDVFITINNKAEGSAPLSVARLAAAIRATA